MRNEGAIVFNEDSKKMKESKKQKKSIQHQPLALPPQFEEQSGRKILFQQLGFINKNKYQLDKEFQESIIQSPVSTDPKILRFNQLKSTIKISPQWITLVRFKFKPIEPLSLCLEFLELVDESIGQVQVVVPKHTEVSILALQQNKPLALIFSNQQDKKKLTNLFQQLQKLNTLFQLQELKEKQQFFSVKTYQIYQLQLMLQKQMNEGFKSYEDHISYDKLSQIYILLAQPNFFMSSSKLFTEIQLQLLFIANHLEVYQYRCSQLIVKVINLFQFKTYKKQEIINILCPQLTSAISKIITKLKIPTISDLLLNFKQYYIKHGITTQDLEKQFFKNYIKFNKLFIRKQECCFDVHFLGWVQQLCKKLGPNQENNNRGKLQQCIRQLQKVLLKILSHQRPNYLDSVTKIFHSIGHQYGNPEAIGFQANSKKSNMLQNIEQQEVPDCCCLGCSQYFYRGQNIVDSSVNKIPIATFQTIKKYQEIQPQLLQKVCAFLNTGGGIILFDIKQFFHQQVAQGVEMSEKMQADIKYEITKMIELRISPNSNMEKLLQVDFVPVCQSLFRNNNLVQQPPDTVRLAEPDQIADLKPQILSSIYVTRLRICPQDTKHLYCVKKGYQYQCFIDQMGIPRKLNQQQKQQGQQKKLIYQEQLQLQKPKPHNFFDHQCQSITHTPQKLPVSNRQPDKQRKFQQMCMIVANQNNLPSIKRKLVEKGYKCSIQLKFINQRFSSAKHTAVLYIDAAFQQILARIAFNDDFKIRGRPLITIRIQTYVRLRNRNENNMVTPQFFLNILQWYKRQYPDQPLELYEYIFNNMIQYYFKTPTKTSCLYVYYILNHLGEKCSLNQPREFDKLSYQQKSYRWTQKYSSVQN